ncbi:S49 family peptidase [Klebsiella quasipneumoniae]|uniref:S49 family peptidase n=1 Tax=Klebsiella quasipneumoniae TaxID=1463165 RepID=UPI00352AA31D
MKNLSHVAAVAFNQPLMLEPSYGRVFFSALGKELGAGGLSIPQDGLHASAEGMDAMISAFGTGDRQDRPYRVENGVAVVPATGTLVHRLGALRPRSGMTGYDGITRNLQMAVSDSGVQAILLDIDSPGGQVAGAFDCADMISRISKQKPVYALAGDMACSAAMLIASACSRRFVTQTGRMGSIGVMMAHASYEEQLKQRGVDITLIYSGSHKVEGNPYEALPEDVRGSLQKKMDETRRLFVSKVAGYMGIPAAKIMDMEAAVYDGAEAVASGLADELINSADIIGRIQQITGGERNVNAVNERERITAIMALAEYGGNDALARTLALDTNVSVEQAEKIISLASGGLSDTDKDNITRMAEEKGIAPVAEFLRNEPGMTLMLAEKIMNSKPESGALQFSKHLMANGIEPESPPNQPDNGRLATLKGIGAYG